MTNLLSNPLFPAIAVLIVAILVLLGTIVWMYLKLRRFLIGIGAEHIEHSLTNVAGDLVDLKKFRGELEIYLADVERRVKKSVQAVHTVRFNPFKGTGGGGDQSFATAFLTEDGEGVVISSLYSREHVSVFSKPVKKYSSDHELSEEEEEALKAAKAKLK